MLRYLFRQPRNLFSYEHARFAEIGGVNAGMILSYGGNEKAAEDLRTGWLFIVQMKLKFLMKLPTLLKFNRAVGGLDRHEAYISNVATFPHYRGSGIGTALVRAAEEAAQANGAVTMVLDVEQDNKKAIELYKRLGYRVTGKSCVPLGKGVEVVSYRMAKSLV